MIYLIIHILLIIPCYILNRKLTLITHPGEWMFADRVLWIVFSVLPILGWLSVVIRCIEFLVKKVKIDWFKEVNW